MKVQFTVCAKDLPTEASYQATLVDAGSGTVLGSTEVSTSTTSPVWNRLVTTGDDFDVDAGNVLVKITKAGGDDTDTVVASSTFSVAAVQGAYYKAVAQFSNEDGDGGAKIALHLTDKVRMGKLQVQLAGHDLPDTDFGMFRSKQHTDGFLELYSSVTGKKLVRSKTVEDDLNPQWERLDLDLDVLTGGKLDLPIRITVSDQDGGDKTQYLGQVMVTVEQLQGSVAGTGLKHFPLIKGGTTVSQGSLSCVACTLAPAEFTDRQATRNLSLVLTTLDVARDKLVADIATKQAAVDEVQTQADKAAAAVEELSTQAKELAAAQKQAHEALASLKQDYDAKLKAAQNAPPSGTLTLQLAAQDLPDTDFGFRNKTDPIFQITVDGKQIFRSNIVENSLNPVWDVATLDVAKIGSLSTPLTIVVSDKDGGDDKSVLGTVKFNTLQDLVNAAGLSRAGTQGYNLPPTKKGKLFVKKAHLDGVKDEMAAVQEFQKTTVQPAALQYETASTAYDALRAQLVTAQEAAATCQEKLIKAKDAAEAAKLALKVMEDAD